MYGNSSAQFEMNASLSPEWIYTLLKFNSTNIGQSTATKGAVIAYVGGHEKGGGFFRLGLVCSNCSNITGTRFPVLLSGVNVTKLSNSTFTPDRRKWTLVIAFVERRRD